ncbi:MAG: tetratricopeptide repeat protein [Bacteroidales bacterium]|nr:tetratricopeptide repeat protein [Bacteroidales bacterium]
MKRVLLIPFLCLLFPCIAFSQGKDNENQLALLYYSQADYEKAADIYQSLFNQTHSQIYFDYLITCYTNLNNTQKAVEITKEQINRYPKSYYYPIKLATIYSATNNNKEAKDIYDKTIKKATKQLESTLLAGQACMDNKVDSVARIIYENGQSKYPDNEIITKNLSEIYLMQGENEKLTNLYISILQDEQNVDFIEKQLQFTLYEKTNPKLKQLLTQKLETAINKNQKNLSFKELYLWMMMQDKNFEKAFAISKQIDIENDEDGDHVYEVGKIALTNYDYKTATDCFSYVVQKGPMADLYEPALKNLLETSYNKLFKTNTIPNEQQILALENEYIKALEELGESQSAADIIINLAHIQAFYLNKTNEAINKLKQATESPNLRSSRNKLQMELADIYVFTNDIWGANMLYASIALNNKNNDIGHEAQLKQARIAYFNGNFSYAQALLDVLKGSTSKLISNDAFELAQLISDNTALDTTTTALEIFARGDLLGLQRKYSQAYECYDSIPKLFPGHSLEDEILMRKADIEQAQNNKTQMITYLQEIENRFSYEIYADKAIYKQAEYYYNEGNYDKAKEKYKKIISDYQNSIYAAPARNKYRELDKK